MVTIYHNPRCAKSRAGLAYLTNHGIDYQLVDYLKQGITPAQVAEFSRLTGLAVTDLIRKNEDLFKSEYKGKQITDEQWCQIIAEHPKLLQRPLIINQNKGILAQPPDRVNEILEY